jgi:hypothetical protein
MMKLAAALIFAAALHAQTSPFVGRWDFNLGPERACWLGVTEKDGGLDVWFQPTGGHVYQVSEAKLEGSHLVMTVSEDTIWDLTAAAGKLTGVQKRGAKTVALTGVPAPALTRETPTNWTSPQPLFNGKDMSGWEPIGDPSKSHWVVQDGLLINQEHGANLKSTRKFEDFKLHFEVLCPDGANSGMYLRGRYEVQLEYEKEGTEPPERGMGSIYGRVAPGVELPRKPGEWETFDITLIGRKVSIWRDGVKTVDNQEIAGITGGALDANEGEPGPFYIQGDHTGGLKFRNITVSVPVK